MKYVNHLFVGLAATGLMLSALAGSANALPLTYTGVCPSTNNHNAEGGGNAGNATDCNLLIVFNADGSISTTGAGGTFEGIDDALIGIVNNSGHTINTFSLTGSGIYAFEGDGIDQYICDPASCSTSAAQNFSIANNSSDTSSGGYGGPLVFFTNIVGNTGTINIESGLHTLAGVATNCAQFSPNVDSTAASGGSTCNATYFSLEGPADLNAPPTVGSVPEPATLTLLGSSLAYGWFRRRKGQA